MCKKIETRDLSYYCMVCTHFEHEVIPANETVHLEEPYSYDVSTGMVVNNIQITEKCNFTTVD